MKKVNLILSSVLLSLALLAGCRNEPEVPVIEELGTETVTAISANLMKEKMTCVAEDYYNGNKSEWLLFDENLQYKFIDPETNTETIYYTEVLDDVDRSKFKYYTRLISLPVSYMQGDCFVYGSSYNQDFSHLSIVFPTNNNNSFKGLSFKKVNSTTYTISNEKTVFTVTSNYAIKTEARLGFFTETGYDFDDNNYETVDISDLYSVEQRNITLEPKQFLSYLSFTVRNPYYDIPKYDTFNCQNVFEDLDYFDYLNKTYYSEMGGYEEYVESCIKGNSVRQIKKLTGTNIFNFSYVFEYKEFPVSKPDIITVKIKNGKIVELKHKGYSLNTNSRDDGVEVNLLNNIYAFTLTNNAQYSKDLF